VAIKDLLIKRTAPPVQDNNQGGVAESAPEKSNVFYELKRKIHGRLVEEANLAALNTLEPAEIRSEIENIIDYYLREEKALLNEEERHALTTEILDELMGLGPLEPFFKDPTVADVLVNTYSNIYVERFGLLQKTNSRFVDNAHLLNIIDRIISRVRAATPACRMVRASTPSSRPWPSTGRSSPSAASR